MNDSPNSIQNFLTEIGNLASNAITVSERLLEGGGKETTVKLQRSLVMPDKMASPPRAHIFHQVDGFIAFLKANKTKDTIVMADVPNKHVYAVLDDKAKDQFEVVVFCPPEHPEFTLLRTTLLDQEFDIADFAKAVLRNRNVTHAAKTGDVVAARDIAMMFQQITVSSKITAARGTGVKQTNGIMCVTEISGGAPSEQPLKLPDSIAFEVPIYQDTPPVVFNMDLTITGNRDAEVFVTTDAPEVDIRKFEVFGKLLEPLKAMEAEGIIVTFGTPKTGEWKYNK